MSEVLNKKANRLKREMSERENKEPDELIEQAYNEMNQNTLRQINEYLVQAEAPEIDSESVIAHYGLLIDSLSGYLEECQKNNVDVTISMVEAEMDKLGIDVEEIFGKNISDAELKQIYEDIVSGIKNNVAKKEASGATALSYIRDGLQSQFAKTVMATTLFLIKFGVSMGMGTNKNTEKDALTKNKITASSLKTISHEGDDGKKTYDATADFKKSEQPLDNKAESFGHLEKQVITSSFDTDKNEIKNSSELAGEFNKFFASISDDNFDQIMKLKWTFTSSSDPRQTLNWGGSNENLSKARFESFLKEFNEARNSFDFKNLSAEQIKQITEKQIFNSYPENGETQLTDLINPHTGSPFTEAEIKKLTPDEKAKLLEDCRYASFEAESAMFEIGKYSECIILVDATGSTEHARKNMSDNLKYIQKNKPIIIGAFDNGLINYKKVSGSQTAAEEILKTTISENSHEQALLSGYEYLEKIPAEDVSSKIMYIATDEGLQDANLILALLQKAEEKNTTVEFLMFYENGAKTIKQSASDLLKNIKAKIEMGNLNKHQSLAKTHEVFEKQSVDLVEAVIKKISSHDASVDRIFAALEKDNVKGAKEGDKEAIRADLLSRSCLDLHELKNIPLGKMLYEAKLNEGHYAYLLSQKDGPIEKQVDNIGSITDFEDQDHKTVKFPIFP